MSILKLLVLCIPFSLASAHEIKVEFNFVDAVVERRIDIYFPEWNRFEILGTGRVFIDGISNDLLGQYDVSSDESVFSTDCVVKALNSKLSNKILVIEGKTNFLPKGSYKSSFYLSNVICR
jgi:hypothetical protein